MSSSMFDEDTFLSEPDERLELEEERRKPSSLCPPCTTSLAAIAHFSVDCFLTIFFGMVGVEETEPALLELLVESRSSDGIDSVRLREVSRVLEVESKGRGGQAEPNDGSLAVEGESVRKTSLPEESATEHELNLPTKEEGSSEKDAAEPFSPSVEVRVRWESPGLSSPSP